MIDLINGQLDRYELKERIGSGGMARVYKAWDTSLERLVAIKVLHEHLADDPTFKERFEREAKFIASFNHPNIVQVYDFKVIIREGFPMCYMVMSYIPGQTLREVLESAEIHGERLSRDRVRELVSDLTGALGYAHQRGMVHRDVKPGNVILNEQNRAVLTDFGIARIVQSNRLTADGVSTGTPIYMSPEQASGQAGDIRSDLYSLGIIVYEMLAGRPPFVDDSSLSVMLKHLNTAPPIISEFIHTKQFDGFFAKALAKKPADRFQTTEEFAQAFRATLEQPDNERTTLVPGVTGMPGKRTAPLNLTTSMFQTISQKARENPRISTAIVVAALGAVALVIILLANSTALRNGQTPAPTTVADVPTVVATVADAAAPERYFKSTFDSADTTTAHWSTDKTDFLTRSFTPDGHYQMSNTQTFTAETSIYESNTIYTNMAVRMVAKLETGSRDASGYGLVFRYQDENNYNVFAVDGMGRYSIWLRSDGEWIELRNATEKWTPDASVLPVGHDNELTISVVANLLTGYVNGKEVTRVTNNTLPAGRIGMYFATDDGSATLSVDSYQVAQSVPSMTGS